MGGLDPAKILIVLLVAVIILGPERLPKAARQLGGLWRELTKLRERLENEVRTAMPDLDLPKIPTMPARGIAGYLTGMMVSSSAEGGEARAAAASPITGPPMLGALDESNEDLLGLGGSPRDPAATDGSGGRLSYGTPEWHGAGYAPATEHSDIPAGWQSVGTAWPGYGSGANLAPVPSSVASGPLDIEASISFDEPSWN